MPGATLFDEKRLTPADIARRIQLGFPSFATSPNRPVIPPLGPMALAPAVDASGALYTQAQLDLTTWAQAYPDACDPRDFGTDPEDFKGTNTPRTERALKSFQVWATRRGAAIRTDGVLDSNTFLVLQRVAQDIASREFNGTAPASNAPPPAPAAARSSLPLWALAGGALALAVVLGLVKL